MGRCWLQSCVEVRGEVCWDGSSVPAKSVNCTLPSSKRNVSVPRREKLRDKTGSQHESQSKLEHSNQNLVYIAYPLFHLQKQENTLQDAQVM
jgi:hypothetical protein